MNTTIKNVLLLSTTIGVWLLVIYGFTIKNDHDSYDRNYNTRIEINNNDKNYKNIYSFPLFHVNSKKNLVFAEEFSNKTELSNFVLRFIDPLTLAEEYKVSVNLPQHTSIMYASKEKIYNKKGHDFFEYDILSKSNRELKVKSVKIIKIFPLNNQRALCLGDIKNVDDATNGFSFFILNLQTLKMEKVEKTLNTNNQEDAFFENILKYSGRFVSAGDKMAYVFDKYGKVLIFNNSGQFLKEIHTIDKINLSEITVFNGMYTYKRGATFSSNSSVLIRGNQLYTFSCKPYEIDYIMVDQYNIEDGKYLSSYKLVYNKKNSSDIELSHQVSENSFVLGFRDHFQSFDIK